ncbi:hypothetical protein ES705_10979 [subsurface metagenome]
MGVDLEKVKQAIRAKVIELAGIIGQDAPDLKDDDVIPEMGYLDSMAIIEFIVWFEDYFKIRLNQSEITIDNFGSINAMAKYLLTHRTKAI